MNEPDLVLHLVPQSQWPGETADYAPASLADEGFVHCSPDDAVTLAVADAFYRQADRPLLVLTVDASRCGSPCVREQAQPVPPPGVADDTLFPHVYGPIPREAVVDVRTVVWDAAGSPLRIA